MHREPFGKEGDLVKEFKEAKLDQEKILMKKRKSASMFEIFVSRIFKKKK